MLTSLQYLRGVAALLVVYFHAVLQVQSAWDRPDTLLPLFGQSGVDLFFVLSGFVMWTSTSGKRVTAGEFYRRRLIRIVPLYWSITLAAAAIAMIAPQLLRSTVFEWGHLVASLLFIPWPNPAFAAGSSELLTPVVIPGWTLNYEMFFYLLFGLTLLVERQYRFWLLGALIVSALLLGRFWGDEVTALSFYGSTMLLEFLAGVAIAAFANWKLPGRGKWIAALLVMLAICLCWFDWAGMRVDRAVQLGLPAASSVLLLALWERSGPVPESRWWRETGDASYSIYLTHVFVIAGLRVVVNALGLPMDLPGELLFVGVALVLSTLVGRLVYFQYERRVTRLAGRLLVRAPSAPGIAPHGS